MSDAELMDAAVERIADSDNENNDDNYGSTSNAVQYLTTAVECLSALALRQMEEINRLKEDASSSPNSA